MKTKLMVAIFIAVIALIAGCDSLWQVSDTSDVTFTIDTSALQSSRSIQFSQNGVNAIDSDDVSKVAISLHNANDDSVIDSKTETFTDDEDDVNIEFKNLKIVGKTVYAKAVLETDGEVKTGVSEAKKMVKGKNTLTIDGFGEIQIATPVFSLSNTDKIVSGTPLAINAIPGATIYYTDGDSEFSTTNWMLYDSDTAKIRYARKTLNTYRAIAIKEGLENSAIAEITYNERFIKPENITNSLGATMVGVKGGTFDWSLKADITLSSFYLGETEVTQGQWEAVMEDIWPNSGEIDINSTHLDQSKQPNSTYGDGDNYPAYYITYIDIVKFCNTLSTTEDFEPVYYKDSNENYIFDEGIDEAITLATTNLTNINIVVNYDKSGYRLPTDAEREYVAGHGGYNADGTAKPRFLYAGTNNGTTEGEDALTLYAWYGENNITQSGTKEVGVLRANPLGFYDMSGNVFEMTYGTSSDTYGYYYEDWTFVNEIENINPTVIWGSHFSLGYCGGSFRADDYSLRVSSVLSSALYGNSQLDGGFRVARTIVD